MSINPIEFSRGNGCATCRRIAESKRGQTTQFNVINVHTSLAWHGTHGIGSQLETICQSCRVSIGRRCLCRSGIGYVSEWLLWKSCDMTWYPSPLGGGGGGRRVCHLKFRRPLPHLPVGRPSGHNWKAELCGGYTISSGSSLHDDPPLSLSVHPLPPSLSTRPSLSPSPTGLNPHPPAPLITIRLWEECRPSKGKPGNQERPLPTLPRPNPITPHHLLLLLLPSLWIPPHKQICSHVIEKKKNLRRHESSAGCVHSPCISDRVFMFMFYMWACVCCVHPCVCWGWFVCIACSFTAAFTGWGGAEGVSIFTRCHSHSAGIINTQTHSHTCCMRAQGCVSLHVREVKCKRQLWASFQTTCSSHAALWLAASVAARQMNGMQSVFIDSYHSKL